MKLISSFVFAICLSLTTSAQEATEFYSVGLDEDIKPLLLFSNARDQNYTLGLGLTYGNMNLQESFILKPAFSLLKIGARQANRVRTVIPSISLAGTGFTPDDLTQKSIIKGDRPYSFLFFISTRVGSFDDERNKYSEVSVNYGMLGLNTGGKLQSAIHSLMNDNDTKAPRDPKGWNNQISNGGEPTILVSFSQSRLLRAKYSNDTPNRGFGYELGLGYRFMAGYYNAASANIFGRIGWLKRENWVIRTQPTQGGDKQMGMFYPSEKPLRIKRKFESYFYGNVNLQFMLYNALLRGQFANSNYRLAGNEVNNCILEWTAGYGCTFYTGKKSSMWNINWGFNTGRTSELNTQYKRNHTWGTLSVTYQK